MGVGNFMKLVGLARRLCRTHLLLALITGAISWAIATPAQAQLASGCVCPAGLIPFSSAMCRTPVLHFTLAPAICPGRNIRQISVDAQDQSFWGINQMLQAKRDQLQATPVPHTTSSPVSGYASSCLEGDTNSRFHGLCAEEQPAREQPCRRGAVSSASKPVLWRLAQGLGSDWERDGALTASDAAHQTGTYTGQGGFDHTQQGIFSNDDAFVRNRLELSRHTPDTPRRRQSRT